MAAGGGGVLAGRALRWTALAIVATVLVACGGAAPGGAPATGTGTATGQGGTVLTVAIPGDPIGLDPYATADAATQAITWNLYDQLVTVAPDGSLQPDLATAWQQSPDGLTWTFHLRQGVTFQDGHPLTAADVAASFRRIMAPGSKHPDASAFQVISTIDTPDPATVVIHLKQYDAPFLSELALPSSAIEPADADPTTLQKQPDGTGPFTLVSWTPGQAVVLRRNPHAWQTNLPPLTEIDYRIIPDPATQVADLLAGSVQVIPRLEAQYAAQLQGRPDVHVVTAPSNNIQILAINTARRPFTDARVRQALNLAIDRSQVIQGAWWGYAAPAATFLDPRSPYVAVQPPAYDPARARQLLAAAGYGQGFAATLTVPSIYPVHVKTGEIIAAELGQVGVHVQLQQVEWASWLSQVYQKRDYDLTIISHTGRLDPDTMLVRFVSTFPFNYENFRDPTYDALIAAGRTQRSDAERRATYAQAERILAEQVPAVFLDASDAIVAFRAPVTGWTLLPLYVDDLKTVALAH
jgi:peptide/nickel transport system substrate-binding protein